ncbi:site-specific integrase [Alcaligenes phenolicus]
MLTDTKCRTAPIKEKPYKLTDGKGLYLEVKPNGVKAWRYRFELAGKENTYAVGDYAAAPAGESKEDAQLRRAGGRFTLAEAREERARCRDLVKQGISPTQHRKLLKVQQEHSLKITFELVAREWVQLRDWMDITKKRRIDMLERVVFPKIGKLPTRQITSLHVLDVLNAADKNNGPSVRDEAKRTMSSIFEYAVSTLRADTDPVYLVRKAHPRNKTQHKRPLEEAEVGQLLRDFEGHGGRYETLAAFQLMWWTLCRPNEAVEAEWAEFDLDGQTWTISAERMKTRKQHKVPLPTQAVAMLRAMHALTGKHRHVFPGRDDKTRAMTQASLRTALHVLGWSGKFSPHATRTTGSTRLNEMNYPANWIERQLAHAEPNVVAATYNHAGHFADRATMMQAWADKLDELKQKAQS